MRIHRPGLFLATLSWWGVLLTPWLLMPGLEPAPDLPARAAWLDFVAFLPVMGPLAAAYWVPLAIAGAVLWVEWARDGLPGSSRWRRQRRWRSRIRELTGT